MAESEMVGQTEIAEDTGNRRIRPLAGLARLIRFFSTSAIVITIVAIGFLIGGFLKFTDTIASYSAHAPVQKGDAIVVYTGGSHRIEEAMKLLRSGNGKRLLISGVNPDISMESLMKENGIKSTLYDCCIDIDKLAADTIGNALEAKKWAEKHNYKSLVIVTSSYHMPRSLLETRKLLPQTRLIPFPVTSSRFSSKNWYKDRMTLRLLLNEYSKYVAAQVRTALTSQVFPALSASMVRNQSTSGTQ